MTASATTKNLSALWQGLTKDGYNLLLTRAGMARISSNLKHAGLDYLVQSNINGSLEGAVVRSIAQVVSNATRSGTLSRQDSGTKIQVFTSVGRTRSYQILTQPLGRGKAGIISIRSQPKEMEQESEYEGESEQMVGGNQTRKGGRHRAKVKNPVPHEARELARVMVAQVKSKLKQGEKKIYETYHNATSPRLPIPPRNWEYIEAKVDIKGAKGHGQYRVVCLVDNNNNVRKKYFSPTHYGTGSDAGKKPAWIEFQ